MEIKSGERLKEGSEVSLRTISSELEKRIGIWFYSTKTEGIGGKIKTKPSDFSIREIEKREEGEEGRYLIVELTKENWDTLLLIREISKCLRISREKIGFAGTKDKFAVATQRISIKDVNDKDLKGVKIADVTLKKIGRSNKPVSLGDLYGNEFEVVIRDIEGRKKDIGEKIENIKKEIDNLGGIQNFFGVQRFGIIRPITHVIGKHQIKGEIEEAVKSYIGEIFSFESEEAKKARILFNKGKIKESLKVMPKSLRYERTMLDALSKCKDGLNFFEAFRMLPKKLQKLFVHAYQSYLFNLVLTHRMKKNLPFNKALVGDIVCFRNDSGFADIKKVEKVKEDKIEGINRLIKKKRAFITAPLFGYKTELTDGLEGEIEREVLKEEKTDLKDYYIEKIPNTSLEGTRRPILAPVNVKVEEISEDEMNKGKFKMKLYFALPKGSYATVLLREYMKMKKTIT